MTFSLIQRGLLVVALSLLGARDVDAEWHIKPFLGVSFAGSTSLVDVENAAGDPNVVFGVSGVLVGEVVGLEVDVGHAPGFFESGERNLVIRSRVTTLGGNIVLAMPRRLNEYGLRPYVVGGLGLMQVRIEHVLDVLDVADTLPAVQVGGGVTGFFSERIGVSWDVRHVRSIRRASEGSGVSFGPERISFWRAAMALALRY